jgi:hypothetical protein
MMRQLRKERQVRGLLKKMRTSPVISVILRRMLKVTLSYYEVAKHHCNWYISSGEESTG